MSKEVFACLYQPMLSRSSVNSVLCFSQLYFICLLFFSLSPAHSPTMDSFPTRDEEWCQELIFFCNGVLKNTKEFSENGIMNLSPGFSNCRHFINLVLTTPLL